MTEIVDSVQVLWLTARQALDDPAAGRIWQPGETFRADEPTAAALLSAGGARLATGVEVDRALRSPRPPTPRAPTPIIEPAEDRPASIWVVALSELAGAGIGRQPGEVFAAPAEDARAFVALRAARWASADEVTQAHAAAAPAPVLTADALRLRQAAAECSRLH